MTKASVKSSAQLVSKPSIGPFAEDWPFPFLLVSPDDEAILWANQATLEWVGKSLRRLLGKRPCDIVEVGMDTEAIVKKCVASNAPLTVRNCAVTREGYDEEYVDLTAFPTENGVGIGVVTAGVQPRQTSVDRQVVSGMGRMIAHELKNPLAGIKGAAQLLQDDVESEEGQRFIDLICSEIDRIRRLADRMETLGDQDPDNEERVNIHEILRRARRVIKSANQDIVFTEQYDPSLPDIKGDGDTLMQALLNLIKNAAEAIDSNTGDKEITLKTRFRSGIKSRANDMAYHLPVEILIIDNGPGVPEDMKEQLFQPFVTTKPEGQGLGLALVLKVVRAHGGIVELKSRPGKTQFSLLLPTPNGD